MQKHSKKQNNVGAGLKSVQKGITLIALIITIVIMLILAGVTINLTIGENGIITQAQLAAIQHKKAQYFEEINFEILEEKTERIIEPKEEVFIVSLKKRIEKKSWTSAEKVIMCKETENGFEQQEVVEENNVLLIETNDKYEIIVDVNNVTLYAKIREDYFEKIGKRLKLTLEPNGGNGDKEEKEVRKGFKVKLEEPSYTKSGYKFVGWCEDKDGNGIRYLAGSEYKVEENTTLYAIWETNTITITLKSNDGTDQQKEITITGNTETTLPTEVFEREGYSFISWNTEEAGTGTEYENAAKITIDENIILYAQWEAKIIATMSISVNNDSSIKKLTEGTKISISAMELGNGIEKIELKIGNQVMYIETVNGGTTYTKELVIEDLEKLENLLFYSENTATLTVTSTNNNSKQISESGIQNFTVGSEISLKKLAEVVNGGNTLEGETILQVTEIDLNGSSSNQFTGIGRFGTNISYPFSGIYNGNNFEIKNVYIDVQEDITMGLFGYCMGTVKNVITSGTLQKSLNNGRLTGGIVGRADDCTIYNCINKMNIVTNDIITGGICGGGSNLLIENCINEGAVSGSWQIGGICSGRTTGNEVIVKNCTNKGTITGQYKVGGIIGYTDSNTGSSIDPTIYKIMGCVNEGNINALYIVGGIAGESYGSIENCSNLKKITSTGYNPDDAYPISYTGGITGINNAIINNCINKGEIEAVYRVSGGIAGRNLGNINYCANIANVSGQQAIGGIVGNNRGYISYVYNIAEKIVATSSTSGVVGGVTGNQNTTSDAYTKYAYSNSQLIGYSDIGGIVGNFSIGTMNNCYNIGNIQATSTTNIGNVYGSTYSTNAITNTGSTTESAMIGWSQATITNNIGNFVKKTNGLPILNITINGETF